MAAFRRLRKLISPLVPSSSKRSERSYSAAAAMAVSEFEHWELPLPVLQDTHGRRTGRGPQWIFLGSPEVGKATYASRLAKLLNVPHISMGNLLRKEAAASTPFSKELANLIMQGKLVPDDVIFSILSKRLELEIEFEESGFIFDGFPRTINQAEVLDKVADVDLVVNMKLREDPILKCLDRCVCAECGRSFDDPHMDLERCSTCKALPLTSGASTMVCMGLLRDRLQTYSAQCKPVEYYYRKQGKLLDFEVVGGIPQTWPRLLSALRLEDNEAALQHQLPV